MRTAKLIFVEGNTNHNKYYTMVDNGSTISVEYGRVGSTCQKATYSSSDWNKKYNEKIKKGYQDVTHLFSESVSSSTVSFLNISDRYISELIAKLEAYAKKTVSTNYLVTADDVTEKQIKEAQFLLNELLSVKTNRELNRILLEIYKTLPRKMKKVQDYLYNEKDDFKYSVVEKVIADEQDLLDAMAQQVKQSELIAENVNDKSTLLDAMGIEIFNVTAEQEKMIKTKLADVSNKYHRAYKVINKKTQERFDRYLTTKSNKKKETFFHGSRNFCVLSILQTGLLLRPTNAVITGKAAGYGSYFADKAKKSLGYTDYRGSYWARGNSDDAFMFLFDVHVGNQYIVNRTDSWLSSLDENKLKIKGNYDSVFFKGGADFVNNEYIVYNESASTINYLIHLK